MSAKKLRVLTGLQPTGTIHIGNYFGALKPALELQKNYQLLLFLADMHALDVHPAPKELHKNSIELAAALLASGFNLKKGYLYCQSLIPELHELTWILACQVPYGMLLRAHSFKDAQAKDKEVNMGLFNYPVLMASDILAPKANLVPVGKDQKQHLEMARDFAMRFNNRYGDPAKQLPLPLPEPLISEDIGTVPGTDGEKMSKSKNNVIALFADDKTWKQQIMSIITDSKGLDEPKDPEHCHIFALYKIFATEAEIADMRQQYLKGGYGYGHAKVALLEKVKATLSPMRDHYYSLIAKPNDIIDILESGSNHVRTVVQQTLEEVKQAVGLVIKKQ